MRMIVVKKIENPTKYRYNDMILNVLNVAYKYAISIKYEMHSRWIVKGYASIVFSVADDYLNDEFIEDLSSKGYKIYVEVSKDVV